MTRIVLLALAMATVLFSPSAQADRVPVTEAPAWCTSVLAPEARQPPVNAADSTAFATAWLPVFARLTAAIPALSPREERWLEEELKAPSFERNSLAERSRERSLQKARMNAVALETLMGHIVGEHDNAVLIRRWLTVISTLVIDDAPHHLTRLVVEKVIPRKALPRTWELLVNGDDYDKLRYSIAGGRDELISYIVLCTLPPLGIGDTGSIPPLPH